MRKYLLVALIMLICVSGGVVQAVTHSTQENFNVCFKMCFSGINDTADYATLINNGNYDVVVIRQRDCDTIQNSLEFFGIMVEQKVRNLLI